MRCGNVGFFGGVAGGGIVAIDIERVGGVMAIDQRDAALAGVPQIGEVVALQLEVPASGRAMVCRGDPDRIAARANGAGDIVQPRLLEQRRDRDRAVGTQGGHVGDIDAHGLCRGAAIGREYPDVLRNHQASIRSSNGLALRPRPRDLAPPQQCATLPKLPDKANGENLVPIVRRHVRAASAGQWPERVGGGGLAGPDGGRRIRERMYRPHGEAAGADDRHRGDGGPGDRHRASLAQIVSAFFVGAIGLGDQAGARGGIDGSPRLEAVGHKADGRWPVERLGFIAADLAVPGIDDKDILPHGDDVAGPGTIGDFAQESPCLRRHRRILGLLGLSG